MELQWILFSKSLSLANAQIPEDRITDGVDLTPVLTGEAESVRDAIFYYRSEELFAARKDPLKAQFITQSAFVGDQPVTHNPPQLYNLEIDPSERFNIADADPDILSEIRELFRQHKEDLIHGEDQLALVREDVGIPWE